MRFLLLMMLPAVLPAGPGRYARLGEFNGLVEVQVSAAEDWMPAERNLPLTEGAWIRTGSRARVEIELEDGGVWRLGAESQGRLSDYTTLSTGQRVTLLALDRGLAYFTGEAKGRDCLMLIAPGAQIVISKLAQVRFEAQAGFSQAAVLQGVARFSSAAAEIDLVEGQTTRVEPGNASRFFLYREVAPLEADKWNAARDQALSAAAKTAQHVAERIGLADLEANGEWIRTGDLGAVWKPRVAKEWTPFRNGRWRWYPALGYTWVADEAWGWLPYHYGRWALTSELGWVWAPASNGVFKPGDVFWMRGAQMVGWGPLAPGEEWTPKLMPRQYAGSSLTFADLQTDAAAIDPAGFTERPKDPLKVAAFFDAPPSPAFPARRLDALRPFVTAGGVRVALDSTPCVTAPYAAPCTGTASAETTISSATATAPAPEEAAVPVAEYIGTVIVTPAARSRSASGAGGAASVKTAVKTASASATAPVQPPAQAAPVNPPTRSPRSPKHSKDAGEERLMNQFQQDLSQNNAANCLRDLDEWSRRYPQSDFADDRLYDYMQSHHLLKRPEQVLEYGAVLLAKNMAGISDEPRKLGILYLVTVSAAAIPRPSSSQRALGVAAANDLAMALPDYFQASKRPAGASEADWRKSRKQFEAASSETLRVLATVPSAAGSR